MKLASFIPLRGQTQGFVPPVSLIVNFPCWLYHVSMPKTPRDCTFSSSVLLLLISSELFHASISNQITAVQFFLLYWQLIQSAAPTVLAKIKKFASFIHILTLAHQLILKHFFLLIYAFLHGCWSADWIHNLSLDHQALYLEFFETQKINHNAQVCRCL